MQPSRLGVHMLLSGQEKREKNAISIHFKYFLLSSKILKGGSQQFSGPCSVPFEVKISHRR